MGRAGTFNRDRFWLTSVPFCLPIHHDWGRTRTIRTEGNFGFDVFGAAWALYLFAGPSLKFYVDETNMERLGVRFGSVSEKSGKAAFFSG